MQDRLEDRYSEIKDLAAEAFQVSRRIDRKIARVRLLRLLSLEAFSEEYSLSKLDDPSKPSRLDNAYGQRHKDEVLEVSGPEDQANPLFDHMVRQDRMLSLARLIIERFNLNTTQAETLLEFHRRRRQPLVDYVSTKPLATIILIGGVAAKTIPKEAFEFLDIQRLYGGFQLYVSALVLGALAVFAPKIVVDRWSLRTDLARDRFLEELLERAILLSRYEHRNIERNRDQSKSADSPEETPRG
jgi:hypothetical protein